MENEKNEDRELNSFLALRATVVDHVATEQSYGDVIHIRTTVTHVNPGWCYGSDIEDAVEVEEDDAGNYNFSLENEHLGICQNNYVDEEEYDDDDEKDEMVEEARREVVECAIADLEELGVEIREMPDPK